MRINVWCQQNFIFDRNELIQQGVTVKTFIMLKILLFQINADLLNFLFFRILKKMYPGFNKTIIIINVT